jgi:predicted nucleotidyltransferase
MRLEEDLKKVILKLSSFFQERDIHFVVVGALVPAVLIDFKQGNTVRYGSRTTRDVDCVILIKSWNEYNRIKQDMLEDGFEERGGTPEHRLFFRETPVDIIPCGGLIQDNTLYWPKSNHRMKMRGYSELFDNVELVKISDGKSVPFASLPMAVFLKIQAYLDRRDNGDLEDIFYILMHYEEIEMSERRFDVVG